MQSIPNNFLLSNIYLEKLNIFVYIYLEKLDICHLSSK